jgi:hypothetical protein
MGAEAGQGMKSIPLLPFPPLVPLLLEPPSD